MVFVLSSYINIEARLHLPRRGIPGGKCLSHFGVRVRPGAYTLGHEWNRRSCAQQGPSAFTSIPAVSSLPGPPSPTSIPFWTIQPRAVNQFKAASNLSICIHALLMPILLAFLTLTPLTFNALFTTSIHSFLGYPLSLRSLTSALVTLSTNLPASILSMYSNRHRTCAHHTHFSHT